MQVDGFCLRRRGAITYEGVNTLLRAGASVLESSSALTRLVARASRSILADSSFAVPGVLSDRSTVERTADGLWVRPTGCDPSTDGFVFYIHGGGYHLGNPGTHALFLHLLADRLQLAVYAPVYVTDDGIEQMHRNLDRAYTAARMRYRSDTAPVLAGDSAGGGLVLTFLDYLAQNNDQRRPYARCLVLLSPWVNLDFHHGGRVPYDTTKQDLDFLPLHLLQRFADRMCPTASDCAASAHTLLADAQYVHALPTTLVLVGGDEVLGDSIVTTFGQHPSANVHVTVYPGMKHVFPVVGGLYDQSAHNAVTDIVHHVRSDRWHIGAQLLDVASTRPRKRRLTCKLELIEQRATTFGGHRPPCTFTSRRHTDGVYQWKSDARVDWMLSHYARGRLQLRVTVDRHSVLVPHLVDCTVPIPTPTGTYSARLLVSVVHPTASSPGVR